MSQRQRGQRSSSSTTSWTYAAFLPPSALFQETDPVWLQAKNALEHLNGFHLQERYIVVLYHMPAKQDAAAAKAELARREEELAQLKKAHDIKDED